MQVGGGAGRARCRCTQLPHRCWAAGAVASMPAQPPSRGRAAGSPEQQARSLDGLMASFDGEVHKGLDGLLCAGGDPHLGYLDEVNGAARCGAAGPLGRGWQGVRACSSQAVHALRRLPPLAAPAICTHSQPCAVRHAVLPGPAS
jgi:hypothetical protein